MGLNKDFENYITGPAQPVVNAFAINIYGMYLLNFQKMQRLFNQCKMQIEQQTAILKFNKRYRSVSIIADVDPVQNISLLR